LFVDGLDRPVHVYWGARGQADLYALDCAGAWANEHDLVRFTPVLSHPAARDHWRGRTGLVHQAVLDDHSELTRFDVYMSGPPAMIDAARESFLARGLPEDRLFYDSFDFAPDVALKIARKPRPG